MSAALIDRPTPTLRLMPCPQCADRRRALVESGEGLQGRCLGCGRLLPAPLQTEAVAAPPRVGAAG